MLIMTLLKYFFWVTCLLCVAVILRFGERDERRGTSFIFIGSVSSAIAATMLKNWSVNITPWLLLIDICVLVAFVRLMFDSQKFWPIWVSSLQLITVLINVLDITVSRTLPLAFEILQGFWVYPMFFAIMMGAYGSHVAARRKRNQTPQ